MSMWRVVVTKAMSACRRTLVIPSPLQAGARHRQAGGGGGGRGGGGGGWGCHVLLVLVTLLSWLGPALPCPHNCFCEPHSKNVHCTDKALTAIPEGIPEDTMDLILNQNTFLNPALTRRNFTHLVKLQKLYLSRCGIETIAVDTFMDLTDLVWLDISNNKISFISDHTFRGLHLKHLFINDNQGVQLSPRAFEGMSTQGLYMHNCGITSLSMEVITPLNGTLRTLWLYQNQLETLSEDWIYLFNSLGHVRLGKNPFHCNCELGWLHKFFNKHTSVFSGGDLPSCASPALVRGKRFSNLTADDFRCDLPTFRNVDAVFDREMGRLTCQARGDPTPTVYWIRPDGTTEIYSPAREDVEQNEGVMYMANVKLTDSTRYKCVASNPAGNVTFSLNVVWPAPPPVPVSPSSTDPTSAPAATTRADNVIIADVTTASSSEGQQLSDEAASEGKESLDWSFNQAEHNGKGEAGRGTKPAADSEVRFTLMDIVGAVVGTFVITLIVCVVTAHLCWRRRERLRQEDHYSVPDFKPPLVPPTRLYIMGEDGENQVRMLNHHCPS
ncbi:leucine-rich repeat and fibronectin type III domain-containing protein 1-like protein [Babylonia areolata]|uniref:leucine-rich repeat and fibronectin type III domain-containing protein 1-like protein n=1 Tax=Babylonia areolata TaxID=304850 RepID=UPI003FD12159